MTLLGFLVFMHNLLTVFAVVGTIPAFMLLGAIWMLLDDAFNGVPTWNA